jgi:regulator of cell morphogenesis and NO signaling
MSHHTITQSPAGTPWAERTVGELVAENPARSRVFQKHQIDFCCQGGRTLSEACRKKGLSVEAVVGQLLDEAPGAGNGGSGTEPANLPPHELTAHLVRVHHDFLRAELPRLQAMADRVARVHGGHTPSLLEVRRVFTELAEELTCHLMKEEMVLFPAIESLSLTGNGPASLDGPLACMRHEHADAETAVETLRSLTHHFTPPPEACNTYRALFAGLRDLADDLQRHIQLEETVLFPIAERLLKSSEAPAI